MGNHDDHYYWCATLFRFPGFSRAERGGRRGGSPAFITLSACAALLLAGVGSLPAAAQRPAAASPPAAAQYGDTLNRYCVTCHNERLKTASLILEKANVANPVADAPVWEKVIGKLRMRSMPPTGMPRPDAAFYGSFVNYLETSLDRAAAANPNPDRSAAHRLNRSEYANVIRDLLAVDASTIDIPSLLPADDAGYGFDNIGDVLTVSPMLMEGYLSASRKISRLAIGERAARPVFETYEVPRFVMQNDRMSEDLPLGSRGGTALRHHFPLDGEYTLQIRLQRNGKTYLIGLEKPRRMDVRLDGETLFSRQAQGRFPESKELKQLVRDRIVPGMDLGHSDR